MTDAVAACLAGRISPEVALARLLLSGLPPERIGPMLPAGSALATLFAAQRGGLDGVARMLSAAGVDHEAPRTTQAIAAMFDRAVAAAPEASVAAYTLGDPALLARATAELVDWLVGQGYAHRSAHVLDFGCGIGRVAASLCPHVAHVLGVDVSAGMIVEARARHGDVPNLAFAGSDGGAPALPPESLDLVLAVDCMPYLVQAGVADTTIGLLAALLRPGGALVILNLSYEGAAADRARIGRWSAGLDLRLDVDGRSPFTLWDGIAYAMRRPDR